MRLPKGWRVARATDVVEGAPTVYYYNRSTSDVSWERPIDEGVDKAMKLLKIMMKELSTKKQTIKNVRQLLTRKFFQPGFHGEAFEGMAEIMATFESSNPERLFKKKLAVLYVIDDVLRRCCHCLANAADAPAAENGVDADADDDDNGDGDEDGEGGGCDGGDKEKEKKKKKSSGSSFWDATTARRICEGLEESLCGIFFIIFRI